MDQGKTLWGLLRRRQFLVPTWLGWLALLGVFGAAALFVVRQAHSFLAVTETLPGGALVVEGSVPDYVLEAAINEFRRGHYEKLYVTGGPLDAGAPLVEYRTYAERGAAILLKLGLSPNEFQAVPAPQVRQDRTYTAMIALRDHFQQNRTMPAKVNLVTRGPHARRSRLLLQYALGKEVQVGVTAVPNRDYDVVHWWRSSPGVRDVIAEALAYGFVFLFRPAPEATVKEIGLTTKISSALDSRPLHNACILCVNNSTHRCRLAQLRLCCSPKPH
jgi:hypothetical protein